MLVCADEVTRVEGRLIKVLRVTDFEDGAEDYAGVDGGETRFPAPAADEAPPVFWVAGAGFGGVRGRRDRIGGRTLRGVRVGRA